MKDAIIMLTFSSTIVAAFYLIRRLIAWRRNARIILWSKTIPVSAVQQHAMWELWEAGQKEIHPTVNPLSKLTREDRRYLIRICSEEFRPKRFGSCRDSRLAAWKYYRNLGFDGEQTTVLIGMHFNMVGRKDLRKPSEPVCNASMNLKETC